MPRFRLVFAALSLTNCGFAPDMPPLVTAAREGRTDLIPILVKQGADPNLHAGVNGWTPLQHAIHKNQKGSVIALLDAGADLNARGDDDGTTLIMAAGYGYTDIVRVLLDRGADPRATLRDGSNALTFAVLGVPDVDRFTVGRCQVPTVKALLARAPDLRFVGLSGPMRALTIAKIKDCPGLEEALTQRDW
jgi:ankyrin repeat protein